MQYIIINPVAAFKSYRSKPDVLDNDRDDSQKRNAQHARQQIHQDPVEYFLQEPKYHKKKGKHN